MDNDYKRLFANLNHVIEELRGQLNSLERTVRLLELKFQESDTCPDSSNDTLWSRTRITELKTNSFTPPKVMNLQHTSPNITRQPQIQFQSNSQMPAEQNVVAMFNALAEQEGHNLKTSRDDFVRKYKVRAFNCTNFEARMNEPVPPPKFVEAPTAPSGEYWAVLLKDNMFAVFPNVKTYSDNHHTARAMGEIFKSNFTPGRTYSNITVEQPAIFGCSETMWFLKKQGTLRLE